MYLFGYRYLGGGDTDQREILDDGRMGFGHTFPFEVPQGAAKSQMLTANISKTVNSSVICQIGRNTGQTRAFQKCIDVDVERKQAQAIASLPDSITHYYAYTNEDFTVISLRLPVPCISERKLYRAGQ